MRFVNSSASSRSFDPSANLSGWCSITSLRWACLTASSVAPSESPRMLSASDFFMFPLYAPPLPRHHPVREHPQAPTSRGNIVVRRGSWAQNGSHGNHRVATNVVSVVSIHETPDRTKSKVRNPLETKANFATAAVLRPRRTRRLQLDASSEPRKSDPATGRPQQTAASFPKLPLATWYAAGSRA